MDAVATHTAHRSARAEFTVFPFRESEALPGHVRAAVDAARATGAEVEVEPLSNVVAGEVGVVLEGVRAAAAAAFAAGATRIAVNVEIVP